MTTNKYDWTNKEKIISDLKQSCSTSEFLDQNGLVCSSGNYDTFKKWLKVHSIKKEEYLKPKDKKPSVVKLESLDKVILTKEEVLCENSIYTRKDANRIIRNENLLPYECNGCENKGEWNGKPLTLQLEHKNGDSCDHRIENLEYLCPNCHSQTNTYGSKNVHNRIFEERIKDILEYDNIGRKEIELLANKWHVETATSYHWLKNYKEKIEACGVTFQKVKVPKKEKNGKHHEIIKMRLVDLETVRKKEDFALILAAKWKITTNGVKKWIQLNNKVFYEQKYVLSPSYKLKLEQNELNNKVSLLIEECKVNNSFTLETLLPLFDMNVGVTCSYIKGKYPELYKKFVPSPSCVKCESNNTTKFGLIKSTQPYRQRYKCLDCNKSFY